MAMPTLTFTPQTELDAVNQMLMSIGQAPLNTLAVSGIKDAAFARLTLHNSLREVLTKGWNFNTDNAYPLAPDAGGKVSVPENSLSIDPCDKTLNYVERYDTSGTPARRFWDKDGLTFVIGKTVLVDVTWFFPFEQIPQAARGYVAHYAGRIFQASQIGSELLYKFTKERETELLAELQREERRTSDANLFDPRNSSGRLVYRNRR